MHAGRKSSDLSILTPQVVLDTQLGSYRLKCYVNEVLAVSIIYAQSKLPFRQSERIRICLQDLLFAVPFKIDHDWTSDKWRGLYSSTA
jgi:hypothetical protein